VHNTLAFVRPDQVDRILHRVIEHFPSGHQHYLDVTRAERRITEVLVFLNLWHFGRLSILYRDNLHSVYCEEFDHPEAMKQAKALNQSPDLLLPWAPLQTTLGSFFDTKKVLLREVQLATWVNPNSVVTSHSPSQSVQKEGELARRFEGLIRSAHGGF
jgi:hypothetical protein